MKFVKGFFYPLCASNPLVTCESPEPSPRCLHPVVTHAYTPPHTRLLLPPNLADKIVLNEIQLELL